MAAFQKHLQQLSTEPVADEEKTSATASRSAIAMIVIATLLCVGAALLAIVVWQWQLSAMGHVASTVHDRHADPGHTHSHGPADDPHDHAAHGLHNHAADGPHDHSTDAHLSPTPGSISHPGHDEAASLALSAQGRLNVGLELVTVKRQDFDRTVAIPATIVDRPGRSRITVSAPMTGIITRIYPIQGEAVVPGQTLFDLRLTHEDVVEKQSNLLRDLGQLDVLKHEIQRLEGVTRTGAVAGKTLLEREYERQKLEATIGAAQQALKLHGLTEEQIATIVDDRQLLQKVAIVAPEVADSHPAEQHEDVLQLQTLNIQHGDHVTAGTPLGQLTDHCVLYIEGQAFEHDADLLNRVAYEGVTVNASVEGDDAEILHDLKVLYIENQVEIESRALRFYVELPNSLVRNETKSDGRRFVGWKHRPGQRVELRIPVESWSDQIVLPVDAIVRDGAESYVFRQYEDHFDRLTVHVLHRDPRWAVIDTDGTLSPGDVVAGKGAFQIHLAMKNKSGAAVDPHAGHNH
jgi:multidrug efflux pump subunit AcrA (membrane-fusion protein)